MNTLRIAFVAALLSASSAHTDSAPHWTAAIDRPRLGKHFGSAARPACRPIQLAPGGVTALERFIGTGGATEASRVAAAKSTGGLAQGIGTPDVPDRDRPSVGVERPRRIILG